MLVNKACDSPRMPTFALHYLIIPRMPLLETCIRYILFFTEYINGVRCYPITIRLHVFTILMTKSFCKLTAEQEDAIWEEYISKRATSLRDLVEFYKISYPQTIVPALSTFSRLLKRRCDDPFLSDADRTVRRRSKGYYSVSILKLFLLLQYTQSLLLL